MAAPHRHNGGPLNEDDARKLWGHVRALEVLAEQKAEISADEKVRKDLAKSDGFDPLIMAAILKRRKAGDGVTRVADNLMKLYEEALIEQGALPLEETRTAPGARRSTDEIAEQLHGEPVESTKELLAKSAEEAAARTLANRAGVTVAVRTEEPL